MTSSFLCLSISLYYKIGVFTYEKYNSSIFISKIKHVVSCLCIMIDSVGLHKCCANRSMETHCGHRVPKKIPGLEALCFTN